MVGVLCVEIFVTRDGELLVNELAPRPHNSGHLTFDACRTSQFEQQVRAVCGLPLGSTELLRPAAMANLLGDLWGGGERGEPDWAALRLPGGQAPPLRQGRAAPGPQDGPPDGARRDAGRGCRTRPRRPAGSQQDRPLTPSFPLPPRGGRGTPPPTRLPPTSSSSGGGGTSGSRGERPGGRVVEVGCRPQSTRSPPNSLIPSPPARGRGTPPPTRLPPTSSSSGGGGTSGSRGERPGGRVVEGRWRPQSTRSPPNSLIPSPPARGARDATTHPSTSNIFVVRGRGGRAVRVGSGREGGSSRGAGGRVRGGL